MALTRRLGEIQNENIFHAGATGGTCQLIPLSVQNEVKYGML